MMQRFQNFIKKIKQAEEGFFFAGQDMFDFSERCENCRSTEGVRKVVVISGGNAPEKKFLCGSCAMVERCKAYIRNHKLKLKNAKEENRVVCFDGDTEL